MCLRHCGTALCNKELSLKKPFELIKQDEKVRVYKYATIYSWLPLTLVLLYTYGFISGNDYLRLGSMVILVIYFFVKYFLSQKNKQRDQICIKRKNLSISGSKYSFKRLLVVEVPKSA